MNCGMCAILVSRCVRGVCAMRVPGATAKGRVAFNTFILLPAGLQSFRLSAHPVGVFAAGFSTGAIAIILLLWFLFDGTTSSSDIDRIVADFTGSCH